MCVTRISLSISHTHTRSHTNTHTLSYSLSLSLPHTHTNLKNGRLNYNLPHILILSLPSHVLEAALLFTLERRCDQKQGTLHSVWPHLHTLNSCQALLESMIEAEKLKLKQLLQKIIFIIQKLKVKHFWYLNPKLHVNVKNRSLEIPAKMSVYWKTPLNLKLN